MIRLRFHILAFGTIPSCMSRLLRSLCVIDVPVHPHWLTPFLLPPTQKTLHTHTTKMASHATESKQVKLDGPKFVTEYDLDISALSQGVQIKHWSLDTRRYDTSSSTLAAILLLKRSQRAAKMLEAYCPICEELMLATSTSSPRVPCSHDLRPDGSFCGFTACARCWQTLHVQKCPGSSCSSDLKEVPPVNAFLAKKIQGLEAQCGRQGCTSTGLTIGSAWTRHRDHECSKRPVCCSDCKVTSRPSCDKKLNDL